EHARRPETDFEVGAAIAQPVCDRARVLAAGEAVRLLPDLVFQHDLERVGQPRDASQSRGFGGGKAVVIVGRAFYFEARAAGVEYHGGVFVASHINDPAVSRSHAETSASSAVQPE